MSASPDLSPLTNPDAAAALSDSKWVALHVPRFGKVRPAYETYSQFLQKVLTEAKLNFAPLAFVEVRPKGIPSFAEKILRKRRDYQSPDYPLPPDPLVRLTDLCGGRVITQTADEVRMICRFIESAFDIDWPNSEDVSQRLKPTEFGYRSVHYIVQVNPAKLKTARIDVEVPAEMMGFPEETLGPQAAGRPLKAEIQVRTLLEHAAASLGHDSIYKTEIQVPGRIKRQHATLSAMLEDVDTGFGHMLASLKELESNYGAHFGRKAIDEEIARLRLVLALDKNNVGLIMRLARFALASGQYEIAIEALTPLRDRGHFGIERRLGQALTEMYWDQPKSKEFLDGRSLLEEACKHIPQDSETLSMLADCVAREDDQAARELFHQAIQADATEPVTLSRYLEFETAHLANDNAVRLSTPMINAAIIRCHRQIEGNVNLPAAWASLAVFLLLLGKPYQALDAIAHLTVLCEERGDDKSGRGGDCGVPVRPCAAGRALSRLRDTLRRLHCIRRHLEGFDWCERAVFLSLAVRAGDADAGKSLGTLSSNKQSASDFKPTDKIVILAGGCSDEIQKHIDGLKPHLLRGCEGLSFKLVCGGTTAGISGLAGDLAECSHGKITGVGYLPHHLPRGIDEDKNPARYKFRISSSGSDFSPMEPLQGWTDIISAGINASRIKVIAFAVGKIARTECAMALALGARVGIVEDMALPKERQFLDPAWQSHPNLIRLPMDAMTLRAFLTVDDLPLSQEARVKWEKAARKAHEEYVASATPRDPALKKWEDLDDSLKLSNYHQIAYWEQMLREHGIGLRPLTDEDKSHDPPKMENLLDEDTIKKLAEMEHGRWNVERLLRGWRRAKTKDIAQKLNPCLAPWAEISDIDGRNFQRYDLDAVRGLPENFREVGLEVYKLAR